LQKVHLIGICGTAMATLAALLRRKGFSVQGSDQDVYPPMSDFLAGEHIPVLAGYKVEHVSTDIDLVVVGNAISRGNPELEQVLDSKIRYCSLPEAIRDHFLWNARSIVIAGTHGKTTTTALTGWLLADGGKDPSVLLGGIAADFGAKGSSYRLGEGREFVIEGDEYDSAFFDKTAKFLKYLPDIAVVNNVELDHADIYPDMESVRLAFRRFVKLIPRRGLLLLGGDDDEAISLRDGALSHVETFGLADGLDWQACDVRATGGLVAFEVRHRGRRFGSFVSTLPGLHNVRNAVVSIAVGHATGLSADTMASSLRRFRGIRRRLEWLGTAAGVTVFDDFAHHPTAVAETLAAVRHAFPDRRIWAVFEPRSASSCKRVFQQAFAGSFTHADEVLFAPVFRTSLPEEERLSVPKLVADLGAAGKRARAMAGTEEIIRTVVGERCEGDLVVIMSNGGFEGIHHRLLDALRREPALT
jgi:UDP-N-acetylmuramate: L-alanyl-gamma-D-glutamyl-meso-diaminopimelate ligase